MSAVLTAAAGYLAIAILVACYFYRALRADLIAAGVRRGGERDFVKGLFNRRERRGALAYAAQSDLVWPLTLPVFVTVRTVRLLMGRGRS